MYTVSLGDFGDTMIGMGSTGGGGMGMASSIVGAIGSLGTAIAGAVGSTKTAKEGTKQAQLSLETARVQYAGQTLALQQRQIEMMMQQQAATTKKKGLPGWAWLLIVGGGVAALGGTGLYFWSKKG